MPLRDHFRPPVYPRRRWEGFHAGWPMVIVQHLVRVLPAGYSAEPRAHLGRDFEIDIGSSDERAAGVVNPTAGGGVATLPWSPPAPTRTAEADLPDEAEYAVEVYEESEDRRLVAAVELVSPANKDRPEDRRAFVAKCATLLRRGVSVAVVGVVTTRHFNLYHDLLDFISHPPPDGESASIYASACRWLPPARPGGRGRLDQWDYPLAVGQPLPELPLWLSAGVSVPLELEASYEETCRALGIP